jgi:hypothetical protein
MLGATPLGDQSVEYRFLVLEQLAGEAQKVLTVMGGPAKSGDQDTSFHNHWDFTFWARGGGRTMNGADCVIRPSFVVGDSYLLFIGSTPTWRSYEKIETVDGHLNPDDKWLSYVKTWLSGAAVRAGAAPDYERVGRFIYAFHRIVTPEDLDLKALSAQHAPEEPRLRAGRLAREFERIVQRGASVPDAALEATLREAAEVHAVLQAWRDSGNR